MPNYLKCPSLAKNLHSLARNLHSSARLKQKNSSLYLILSYFQADHLAANRTSENILKTVGSEKKVVGAQVLKKKSGDDAVQVSLNDYRYQNLRITNLFTVWSSDTRFLVQEKNLCCLRSKIV